ncbi:hypothetical protein ACFOEK_01200 [Litoribrevibacter euphylliae]|uniref:Uncharacterized protein n=1 Tax=Litoribrevibacter euphylliae TaxID=1834034 RepID=A0ABV7HE47_9GAMM
MFSQTANRKPQTANRKPQTANRKPQTANRKPQTANRKPQTANRKPQTAHDIYRLFTLFFCFLLVLCFWVTCLLPFWGVLGGILLWACFFLLKLQIA